MSTINELLEAVQLIPILDRDRYIVRLSTATIDSLVDDLGNRLLPPDFTMILGYPFAVDESLPFGQFSLTHQ